jgi:hypothetical protein
LPRPSVWREVRANGLPPRRVISDLIVNALKVKRPKTRYHGGMLADPMLLMRRPHVRSCDHDGDAMMQRANRQGVLELTKRSIDEIA